MFYENVIDYSYICTDENLFIKSNIVSILLN